MLTDSAEDSGEDSAFFDCAARASKVGWKKAQVFLHKLSDSSSSKENSELSPTSLSTEFFTNLSPEMCVDLLRHNSPKIYKNLRKKIASADNQWMETFFHLDGLNVLFEMLEEMTDPTHFSDSSLSSVLMPMYCVECVKAILKNTRSMDLIIGQPDYALKLVQAIGSEKFAVRSNAVQLLSALAYYSEKGCQVILGALQNFQKKSCKKYWTEIVVDELKNQDTDYKASLMALINCIMFNVDFEKRTKIRNELFAVGLKELLHKLHDQAAESARLSIQLALFEEYGEDDRKQLERRITAGLGGGSLGCLDINDPYDLFVAVMRKIDKTPFSSRFLTILQSLILLDLDSESCFQQWDSIEQFVAAVCSLDGTDAEMPVLLGCVQRHVANLFSADGSDCHTQTDLKFFDDRCETNKIGTKNGKKALAKAPLARGGSKRRFGLGKKFTSFWRFHKRKNVGTEETGELAACEKHTKTARQAGEALRGSCKRSSTLNAVDLTTPLRKVSALSDQSLSAAVVRSHAPSSNHRRRHNSLSSLLGDTRTCSLLSCRPLTLQSCRHANEDVAEANDDATTKMHSTSVKDVVGADDPNLSDDGIADVVAKSSTTRDVAVEMPLCHESSPDVTSSDDLVTEAVVVDDALTPSLREFTTTSGDEFYTPSLVGSALTSTADAFVSMKDVASSPASTSSVACGSVAALMFASGGLPSYVDKPISTKAPRPPPPPPPLPPASLCSPGPRSIRPIIPAPAPMLSAYKVRGRTPNDFAIATSPSQTIRHINLELSSSDPKVSIAPPPTTVPRGVGVPPPPPLPSSAPSASGPRPPPPPPVSPHPSTALRRTGGPPPPPPPPTSASTKAAATAVSINERFYTFPVQKHKKTKTLYWNKVMPGLLAQKPNVLWTESADVPINDVNLSKIEELFCCEMQPSTSHAQLNSQNSTSSLVLSQSDVVTYAAVSKTLDQVYILDQKTSLKISLFLKQFRGLSTENIVDLVVANDVDNSKDDRLTLERLRGLQRCMVGVEQYITDVQNYDGDYAKLGLAEKFIWHVGQHKFFSVQLDVKCLQKEFDDKCKNFACMLDTLIESCQALRNNNSLKSFLFLALRIGNYLNLGSSNGPAAGFKISSLKQLYGLKSTCQNSTTLLHVLVENALNSSSSALNFAAELVNIHKSVKIDYETTKSELQCWASDVKKLIDLVRSTTDAQFVERTGSFFEDAEKSLKELTGVKVNEVEKLAKSLQEYFCDDLKLNDMLTLFSDFFKAVQQAKNDNEQKKLKEQRLAKQRELQESRKASAANAPNLLNKRRSSGKEDSLVETLLSKIRDGDISPRCRDFSSLPLNAPRKSRHFAKFVMVGDQGRERSKIESILR